ncbi:MAG: hypothetical protein HYZ50_27305 [Deltaproteobacteria bacterium]|nr:hypothetical protein [Deltaproteobacteria bacterium]
MAHLTAKEFEHVVVTLADHLRFDRLHEKLLQANALVSRKRPASVQVLAGQLYQLSAGLRRNHPARHAIEFLWQDMLSERMKEEQGKTLEALTDRVNGCLTEKFAIVPEKQAELIAALGAYYQAMSALTNDEVAYLEVLMRASVDVAQFLRENKEEVLAAGAETATSLGTTTVETAAEPEAGAAEPGEQASEPSVTSTDEATT